LTENQVSVFSTALTTSVTVDIGCSVHNEGKPGSPFFTGPGCPRHYCNGWWLFGDPGRPAIHPRRSQLSGASFFGAAQPGKLRVQCGDGFGSALPRGAAEWRNCRWRWHQGATGSLIAGIGFAAECSDAAQSSAE